MTDRRHRITKGYGSPLIKMLEEERNKMKDLTRQHMPDEDWQRYADQFDRYTLAQQVTKFINMGLRVTWSFGFATAQKAFRMRNEPIGEQSGNPQQDAVANAILQEEYENEQFRRESEGINAGAGRYQ